jgi:hypothetical protein
MKPHWKKILGLSVIMLLIASGVQAKEHKASGSRMGEKEYGCPKMMGMMQSRHHAMGYPMMKHKRDYDDDDYDKMDLKDKLLKKFHMILKYKEEINLSEQQKEDILEEKYALKKELIQMKADIKILKLDFKKELMQDTLDVTTINQIIDRKYAKKSQKAKRLIEAYVMIKDVLSEKQYDHLKEIWQEHKDAKSKYYKKGKSKSGMKYQKGMMHHKSGS